MPRHATPRDGMANKVLIVGSGSSFHNMRLIMGRNDSNSLGKQVSDTFNGFLHDACCKQVIIAV